MPSVGFMKIWQGSNDLVKGNVPESDQQITAPEDLKKEFTGSIYVHRLDFGLTLSPIRDASGVQGTWKSDPPFTIIIRQDTYTGRLYEHLQLKTELPWVQLSFIGTVGTAKCKFITYALNKAIITKVKTIMTQNNSTDVDPEPTLLEVSLLPVTIGVKFQNDAPLWFPGKPASDPPIDKWK